MTPNTIMTLQLEKIILDFCKINKPALQYSIDLKNIYLRNKKEYLFYLQMFSLNTSCHIYAFNNI